MKLHEIELYTDNPEAENFFYDEILGLPVRLDQSQLKVFDPGVEWIDLNISSHYPEQKISLSFLVKDIEALYENLKSKNILVDKPKNSHLGLRAIEIIRSDIRIVFH